VVVFIDTKDRVKIEEMLISASLLKRSLRRDAEIDANLISMSFLK